MTLIIRDGIVDVTVSKTESSQCKSGRVNNIGEYMK